MSLQNRAPMNQASNGLGLAVAGVVVGFVAAACYSLQAPNFAGGLSIFAVSMMIAGGTMLTGGLLGFLFGIPRTLQQAERPVTPENGGKEGNPGNPSSPISYQVNTNLEQISDWLTKILVGVGLTQITSAPAALTEYARYVAPALGGFTSSSAFAAAFLIYFLVCGFLIGYLWTRLYLAGAFRQADLAVVSAQLTLVQDKVSELERQSEIDTRARNLVQQFLNPTLGQAPGSQEELNEAIRQASAGAAAEIFYQAQGVRGANWRAPETKPAMERTIPVFRALIASDSQGRYHASHGQLGFALKDKLRPDWREAEQELSEAIRIRGPWQKNGWVLYEFNRALCRIHLDPNFAQDQPTEEGAKQDILEDLRAAASVPDIAKRVAVEPDFVDWFRINKVQWSASSPQAANGDGGESGA